MKINFTNKQFEKLLKLVYLGEWMVNAHRIEDTYEEYEKLREYIFSFAKDFGFEDYSDNQTVGDDKYYPTDKFEFKTDVHKFHEEYDEETFWNEIIARLTDRDFFRKYKIEEIKKMKPEARMANSLEFEEKYTKEINKHGIERLEIKH